MKTQTMTTTEAIKQSQDRNEIVWIYGGGTIQAELIRKCDDWTNNGDIFEYWGEDENGTWRIHVRFGCAH